MAAGMADVANEIFYDGKLVDGHGSSLASRPIAAKFKELFHTTYTHIREESESKAHPVFSMC